MNYFEFYSIPVSFLLDEKRLKSLFYQKSRDYHPDFHTLASEDKQTEVLELSTLNNNAYETLSNFDKRMKYVLGLKGILSEEGKNKLPQDFLFEMMEFNEAAMELEFDFNQTDYDQLLQKLASTEQTLLQDIELTLNNYEDKAENIADLSLVKDYYLKKRYLLRIQENLNKFAPH